MLNLRNSFELLDNFWCEVYVKVVYICAFGNHLVSNLLVNQMSFEILLMSVINFTRFLTFVFWPNSLTSISWVYQNHVANWLVKGNILIIHFHLKVYDQYCWLIWRWRWWLLVLRWAFNIIVLDCAQCDLHISFKLKLQITCYIISTGCSVLYTQHLKKEEFWGYICKKKMRQVWGFDANVSVHISEAFTAVDNDAYNSCPKIC